MGVAGLLVGFGKRLGSGCASGHGVGPSWTSPATRTPAWPSCWPAVAVSALGQAVAHRMKAPLFDTRFAWPRTWPIDRRLVAGSAIFGVGDPAASTGLAEARAHRATLLRQWLIPAKRSWPTRRRTPSGTIGTVRPGFPARPSCTSTGSTGRWTCCSTWPSVSGSTRAGSRSST